MQRTQHLGSIDLSNFQFKTLNSWVASRVWECELPRQFQQYRDVVLTVLCVDKNIPEQ